MSVTNRHSEDNFVHNDYNTGKIFIWNNRYRSATFKNNTGGLATILAGTVLGRDSSDNTIVPLDPAVTGDGKEIPVGILTKDITDIADAATLESVTFASQGDVAESRVLFQGGDKNSVIVAGGNRSIEDLLRDIGVILVESENMTAPDNA